MWLETYWNAEFQRKLDEHLKEYGMRDETEVTVEAPTTRLTASQVRGLLQQVEAKERQAREIPKQGELWDGHYIVLDAENVKQVIAQYNKREWLAVNLHTGGIERVGYSNETSQFGHYRSKNAGEVLSCLRLK
jgi:hypothetical protein